MPRGGVHADDPITLAALGGLAYVAIMVTHEAVGHGIGCVIAGGHPVVTSVATQCQVESIAMVAAGPLLNWITGIGLALHLPGHPRSSPHLAWLLWLVMTFSLLLAAGYLLFCGVAGFGDWATVASRWSPPGVWRPAAAIVGGGAYYLALLVLARRRPLLAGDGKGDRLRRLLVWPYLGAGIVACLAGLFNPIDLTRRLLLPIASSFGACFGATRIPDIDVSRSSRASDEALAPIDRRPAWLIAAAIVVVAFAGIVGPGTR